MLENDDFDNLNPDMPHDDDMSLGDNFDENQRNDGLDFGDSIENLGEVNNVEGNDDFVGSFTSSKPLADL